MKAEPNRPLPRRIAIDMTPMIDIVFQLLTFFCMTLKIATDEGDFQIRMPAQTGGEPSSSLSPVHVYLEADMTGECTRVRLAEVEYSGHDRWDRLHQRLAHLVGDGSLAADLEVELHCDSNLRYQHAIAAITAISGHRDARTGEVIKLIDKIKFAPPRN